MSTNEQIKSKILDRANEICYERFSTSLYDICGLNDNDADYIKELLLGNSLSAIKTMGVGTFISSIPLLSDLLLSNAIHGSKDRALRRLYDNKIIITLMEKIDTYLENVNDRDKEQSIDEIASNIVEEAIYLTKY